jgi:hypothetical protein
MKLWQIEVISGVMLEDGAELKVVEVVTGLEPGSGTTGRFPTRPTAGR